MAAKLSQSVFRDHGRAPPIVDAHGGKVDILMNAFIRRRRRDGRHAQPLQLRRLIRPWPVNSSRVLQKSLARRARFEPGKKRKSTHAMGRDRSAWSISSFRRGAAPSQAHRLIRTNNLTELPSLDGAARLRFVG